MAKIRKRGDSYQIDYRDPNGKRIRLSFDKKKDAEAELGKRVSLIAEKRYLDVKREYTNTLKDLLKKYAENYEKQASYGKYKTYCVENFREHFGEDTLLASIRYVDLETYRNKLRSKLTVNGTLRADASVNREMACLHHIFRKAVEWDMVEKNPFDAGKSLLLKENNQRIRYLTEEEVTRLMAECKPKKHLHRIVVCALNTGMRKGEILSLRWSQIRNGFIYLEKTKTNERREIPVNEDLDSLFKEIRKEQGLTSEYVFTYAKRLISRIDRAFHGALKRAGIEDFKFHDLRHTFASHLIMKGGTLKEAQELLGHKTMTMTLRYAHLSQDHKKRAVSLLNGLTSAKMSQMVTSSAPALSAVC
ncbi:MAG: site-specific integrase [Desulfobacteraceae bacterium]|nr:MAG: site-specific integrase [Desulfobacteraceae bacterium]